MKSSLAAVALIALALTACSKKADTGTAAVAGHGPVAPDWPTGIALGIGGIAGGYLGARMQSRLPDTLIRRTVGILAIAIGATFLRSGLS